MLTLGVVNLFLVLMEYPPSLLIPVINPNSKAFHEGLQVDDLVVGINGQNTHGLNHSEVQSLIKNANTGSLTLLLQRDTHTHNGHVNGGPRHSIQVTSGGDSSLGSTESLLEAGPSSDMNGPGPFADRSSSSGSSMAAWSPQGHNDTNNNITHHPYSQSYGDPDDPSGGRHGPRYLPPPSSSSSSHQHRHQRPAPGYRHDHRQGELDVDYYPPPSSSPFSSSSLSSWSPASSRKLYTDVSKWQTAQGSHDYASTSSGHASTPHPHQAPDKPEPPAAPPQAPLKQPPPLPVQVPAPYLRPIVPPSQIPSTNYKPYPDHPPPPTVPNTQLSPKIKHRLVAPTQNRQQQQQQPVRRIHQQPMSPPSKMEPVPMREFVKLLKEDLESDPPKESAQMSAKEKFEDYQGRRLEKLRPRQQDRQGLNQLQKQQQWPAEVSQPMSPPQQHHHVQTNSTHRQPHHHQHQPQNKPQFYPQYPADSPPGSQQFRTLQHPRSQPPQPSFHSPPLHRHEADHDGPRSPSQYKSNIYRPTAISDIFRRGSPTPSLPGDFLRQKQPSPTPSVTSTSSEYVLSGGRGRASKSRGINLFLKQQERLAAMGADVQDIQITEGVAPPDFESQSSARGPAARSKSLQSSPIVHEKNFPSPGHRGHLRSLNQEQYQQQQLHPSEVVEKPWNAPARSISVDAGTRRIPIPVVHAAPSKPSASIPIAPAAPRARRHSQEEASFPGPAPGSSHLSSSWQNSHSGYFPLDQSKGRDIGPGSYATLPVKGSRQRAHHEHFDENEQQRTEFDNTFSSLPTITPLRSSATFNEFSDGNKPLTSSQSYDFGRRDLEHTLDYKDYSKPLWANTDLDNLLQSSISSQDEGQSPHSDNAVSSSDSRDTIIAKDDKSPAGSFTLDSTEDMKSQEKPLPPTKPVMATGKLIPITVVHEQPSRPPVFYGAPTSSQSFTSPTGDSQGISSPPPSKPSHSYQYTDKPSQNGPSSSIESWAHHSRANSESKPSEASLKSVPAIWKPGGVSSYGVKKEYRPVRLDTSKKPVDYRSKKQAPPAEESFAWKSPPPPPLESTSLPTYTPLATTSSLDFQPPPPPSRFSSSSVVDQDSDSRHMNGNSQGEDSRLPPTQSPYITLLQKSRDSEETTDILGQKFSGKPIIVNHEGQLPKGAQYIGSKESTDGDKRISETYYTSPAPTSTESTKVVTEVKPVKYDGIGPIDQEGIPLGFRKNVEEEKQHDWYKQMYKSLHRTDKKEDQLGINDMIDSIFQEAESNTYKPTYSFPDDISDTKSEEGLDDSPYRPSYGKPRSKVDESGYRSEPEGRYKNLMKNRSKSISSDTKEVRRNPWAPSNVTSRVERYRCQPRSIMDYEPGFSSIAFREQRSPYNPRIEKPGDYSQYSENYRGPSERADGDGGEDERTASEKYKKIVHGGDIPLRGLQKPAPEKTKRQWCAMRGVMDYVLSHAIWLATLLETIMAKPTWQTTAYDSFLDAGNISHGVYNQDGVFIEDISDDEQSDQMYDDQNYIRFSYRDPESSLNTIYSYRIEDKSYHPINSQDFSEEVTSFSTYVPSSNLDNSVETEAKNPFQHLTKETIRSSSSPSGSPIRTAKVKKETDADEPVSFTLRRSGTAPQLHNIGKDSASYKGSFSVTSDRSSRLDPHTYQSYAAGILYSSGKSEKFLKLQKHFEVLGRISGLDEKKKAKHSSGQDTNCEDSFDDTEEIIELYSELEAAQSQKEFFFNTTDMNKFHWRPEKDKDLQKSLGMRDRLISYQEAVNVTENINPDYRKEQVPIGKEMKRDVSFGELYTKYDNTKSQKEPPVSSGNSKLAQKSYIEIMENAAKQTKRLPIYGTNIGGKENLYEKHVRANVGALRHVYDSPSLHSAKSTPDLSYRGDVGRSGVTVKTDKSPSQLKSFKSTSDLSQPKHHYNRSAGDSEEEQFLASSLETLPSYSDIQSQRSYSHRPSLRSHTPAPPVHDFTHGVSNPRHQIISGKGDLNSPETASLDIYEIKVNNIKSSKQSEDDSGGLHIRASSAPYLAVAPLIRTNSSKDTFFGSEFPSEQDRDHETLSDTCTKSYDGMATHENITVDDILFKTLGLPQANSDDQYSEERDQESSYRRPQSKDIFAKHLDSSSKGVLDVPKGPGQVEKKLPGTKLFSTVHDDHQKVRSRLYSDHSEVSSPASSPALSKYTSPNISQYEELITRARRERMARKGYLHSYVNEPTSAGFQPYSSLTDSDFRFRNAYPNETEKPIIDQMNQNNKVAKVQDNSFVDDPFSPSESYRYKINSSSAVPSRDSTKTKTVSESKYNQFSKMADVLPVQSTHSQGNFKSSVQIGGKPKLFDKSDSGKDKFEKGKNIKASSQDDGQMKIFSVKSVLETLVNKQSVTADQSNDSSHKVSVEGQTIYNAVTSHPSECKPAHFKVTDLRGLAQNNEFAGTTFPRIKLSDSYGNLEDHKKTEYLKNIQPPRGAPTNVLSDRNKVAPKPLPRKHPTSMTEDNKYSHSDQSEHIFGVNQSASITVSQTNDQLEELRNYPDMNIVQGPESSPSASYSSDGSTGTFIVNPSEYERSLAMEKNLKQVAGSSSSSFIPQSEKKSSQHLKVIAAYSTNKKTSYDDAGHDVSLDLRHLTQNNVAFKSQKKPSVSQLKNVFEQQADDSFKPLSRTKSAPDLSDSGKSFHSVQRTVSGNFADIRNQFDAKKTSPVSKSYENKLNVLGNPSSTKFTGTKPLQTAEPQNIISREKTSSESHNFKQQLPSRVAHKTQYNPYLPHNDIYKEIQIAREGRKLDVPRNKPHTPSLVGQMTLEYFDQIGTEWKVGGAFRARMINASGLKSSFMKENTDVPNTDSRANKNVFDSHQTDDMKLRQSVDLTNSHIDIGQKYNNPSPHIRSHFESDSREPVQNFRLGKNYSDGGKASALNSDRIILGETVNKKVPSSETINSPKKASSGARVNSLKGMTEQQNNKRQNPSNEKIPGKSQLVSVWVNQQVGLFHDVVDNLPGLECGATDAGESLLEAGPSIDMNGPGPFADRSSSSGGSSMAAWSPQGHSDTNNNITHHPYSQRYGDPDDPSGG
ncbi:hypothetical protein Btru_073469, partial [Bulinus truncatus]